LDASIHHPVTVRCWVLATAAFAGSKRAALFVWTYQQNQQPSSSVFLTQQTSEQCFQHNKPAKRTGCWFFRIDETTPTWISEIICMFLQKMACIWIYLATYNI
jgi:hypothetical protein